MAPENTSGVVELCGRCAIRKAFREGRSRRKCYKMHTDMKRAKRDKTRQGMKTKPKRSSNRLVKVLYERRKIKVGSINQCKNRKP